MKTSKLQSYIYYLLICLILTTSMKCKKDETGIEALPPTTQEGKNTFGCLVNGEAFTPKGSNLGGPVLSSYYQYLNSPTAQGYFFNVSADMEEDNISKSISIGANNVIIKQGSKYQLKNYPNVDEVYARLIIISNSGSINQYETINIYKGELLISKFDETKQIVSGTFWFDAVNKNGEKVEVREGRFDVKYVQ
jgi:hypothetical protein